MAAEAQPAAAQNEQAEACPSCGSSFLGKFCYACGEKWSHRDHLALGHFAAHAFHEVTHLDAKVFATLRYLFTRPGYLTVEYVAGKRSRYMKPLNLFLMAVALLFLADSIHPLSAYNLQALAKQDKQGKINAAWEKLAAKKHLPKEVIEERVQERIHRMETAVQFANVLGMAVILSLMYRKRYFVEHLIMALHYLAFVELCSILSWPATSIFGNAGRTLLIFSLFKAAGFITYLFFAFGRVYQQNKGITLVKTVTTFACLQLVLILTPIVTLVGAVVAAARS